MIKLPTPTVYYAQSPLDCQRITEKLNSERQWKNLNSQIKCILEYEVDRKVSDKVSSRVRKQVWEQAKYISMIKLQIESDLKMLNPSVKVWHIEGVPPQIKTCEEALAWRDSEMRYIIPE
ncbi:MAG: hypothetical protein HY754_07180 [Nitrospirae bacterium]|nr:hypothetical protein [Nitrospirota bacterium]